MLVRSLAVKLFPFFPGVVEREDERGKIKEQPSLFPFSLPLFLSLVRPTRGTEEKIMESDNFFSSFPLLLHALAGPCHESWRGDRGNEKGRCG